MILELPLELRHTDLLNIASHFSHLPGTCLLLSGTSLDSAQDSFLFLFPYETVLIPPSEINPWEQLEAQLVLSRDPFPLWVGFLSYEMGHFADTEKRIPPKASTFPLAYFQKSAVTLWTSRHNPPRVKVNLDKANSKWLDTNTWKDLCSPVIQKKHSPATLLKSGCDRKEYFQKIEAIQEHILNGDVYQINLSQEFIFESDIGPFSLYQELFKINPAPFSAYLKTNDYTIVSSSPERLLCHHQGVLETRPIKGTIRRGQNPLEDAKQRERLLHSVKDKAELLMITDLMRNDLGKISLPGSVVTEKIWECESYTNVHHMLSVIKSKALPELSPVSLVRSCFPGGSISGCPKLRALEIIAAMEEEAREIYTGSIGYFCGNGDFDFNIAIRTSLHRSDNRISLRLGGAIVHDSQAENEYQETLDKGASFFNILNPPLANLG